jgi:acyl carrier protein
MGTLIEKVIQILAEVKNDPALVEKSGENTDIINEIGLDSLQMINFALRVEDEFGIVIDFEAFDFDLLLSLKSFCDFLAGIRESVTG